MFNLLSIVFPFKSKNMAPKVFCAHYIIEYLVHSWGTPLKNCLDAVFKKGFHKASNYLENLWHPCIFKALTWIWWLSKVNGLALPKVRCIKVDKAPPEKMNLRKNLLTIETPPPQSPRRPIRKQAILTIGYHQTNRSPTLPSVYAL